MDKFLMNYLMIEKYLPLSMESKKMILSTFKGYDTIVWKHIDSNRALYKIDDGVRVPLNGTKGFETCLEEMKRILELNIEWIDPKSVFFPETLRQYKPEVKLLFAKGDKTLLKSRPSVAIVGSRKPTAYGRKVAHDLGKFLATNNICVVSGMAMGIDAMAHRGALDASGRTIAVLASGVNRPYPTSNAGLYQEILSTGGLVLSEQFIDDFAMRHHFPLRNRIISAVSDCVIIIEAGEKSGSLITATHAMEQGKTVFSLPGSIYSPQSFGSNQLIYEGASPLVNFGHVLESLGIASAVSAKKVSLDHLTPYAKIVYKILEESKRIEIDEIFKATQFEYSEIISAIGELILEDLCEYVTLNEIALL